MGGRLPTGPSLSRFLLNAEFRYLRAFCAQHIARQLLRAEADRSLTEVAQVAALLAERGMSMRGS
jgi:hypothetical protein